MCWRWWVYCGVLSCPHSSLPAAWQRQPCHPACGMLFPPGLIALWPGSSGEQSRGSAGAPSWGLGAFSWETTGTPPAPYFQQHLWRISFEAGSLPGKHLPPRKTSLPVWNAGLRNHVLCLGVQVQGRGNNSRLYSCLAHIFGFELCSLQDTDELLLKVTLISSQASGKVFQFFQAASVPITTCFLSIIDNPNPL